MTLLLGLAPAGFADAQSGPDEVPLEELLKPGLLPDMALGKAEAPVTVVEYASLVCSHCAKFHNSVYPEFKVKYVDTGKVRFILREFPTQPLNRGYAAAMLARCAGGDKALPLVEGLFHTQAEWAYKRTSEEFKQSLFEVAKQTGFTQESFTTCLSNQKLLEDITAGVNRAQEVFGISGTPSFFVNGKRLRTKGIPEFKDLEEAIEPLLAKS